MSRLLSNFYTITFITLIKKNLINKTTIIMNSKSGYSGAGKNLKKIKHKNIFLQYHAYGVISNIDIQVKLIRKLKKFQNQK